MSKVTFAVGFGAGYVLGSRAGRQRYEQIARLAQKIKESPTVQSTAGTLGAQASDLADRAKGRVKDVLPFGSEQQPAQVKVTVEGSGVNGTSPH